MLRSQHLMATLASSIHLKFHGWIPITNSLVLRGSILKYQYFQSQPCLSQGRFSYYKDQHLHRSRLIWLQCVLSFHWRGKLLHHIHPDTGLNPRRLARTTSASACNANYGCINVRRMHQSHTRRSAEVRRAALLAECEQEHQRVQQQRWMWCIHVKRLTQEFKGCWRTWSCVLFLLNCSCSDNARLHCWQLYYIFQCLCCHWKFFVISDVGS